MMPSWTSRLVAGLILLTSSPLTHVLALRPGPAAPNPLFPYEENPLTDKSLRDLVKKQKLGKYSDLFAFEGKDNKPSPDRLKSGRCRVFPGDKDWPSPEKWDAFDKILSAAGKVPRGALIDTIPSAASCYKNLGVYDEAKCAAVTANFTNQHFHEDDPTSIFWPLFQGRTCMPPSLRPDSQDDPSSQVCTHGGFPVYAANISDVSQIQLAINFARNNNLRLVIKNTGHDYLGKSSGAGALSIWTHNLKNIQYFDRIKIDGYEGPALKVGAGVTVREVYRKADENGVSALGGICESVGYAGGYVTGGGHTPLSGLYGMAADHVMALEVVTADGRYVTASPSSNPDLYWALRGGGGGTYGVTTSIIIRVHPKIPVVTSEFSFSTSPTVSFDTFWAGVRAYLELFIPFTDAGTYSWWTLFQGEDGSYSFEMDPFFAPNHTIESFNALVKPWFDRLAELGIPFDGPTGKPNTTQHSAFYPAYASTWGAEVILNGAGRVSVPGNWIFPRRNWEDPTLFNSTIAAMRQHITTPGVPFLFGYHQAPRNRANADNAVSPAWRNAVAFFILSAVSLPTDPTPAQLKAVSNDLNNRVLPLFQSVAPVSAGGGSYLNEANVDFPDGEWQGAFYGVENYKKLEKIKKKWDPFHVFYATTAVGSEGWVVKDQDLEGMGGYQGVKGQNGRLCRI